MKNKNLMLQQFSLPINRSLFGKNDYNSWYDKTVHDGDAWKGERMEVQLPLLLLKKDAKQAKMKQKE